MEDSPPTVSYTLNNHNRKIKLCKVICSQNRNNFAVIFFLFVPLPSPKNGGKRRKRMLDRIFAAFCHFLQIKNIMSIDIIEKQHIEENIIKGTKYGVSSEF